ncbi:MULTISPECIES: ATP-binding protein [unclassified Corallococcus]|uniref:ATP-binding protein n=1 Tax=unclassified Corallococcus TaxID=2685029 RepID=UPI001A8DD44D|nr:MULTISPECIES: ATP-binding protein [unclassified Corallococcus]MBN9681573.1 response regulator [Corallococcus sp. NCSPR001]WAS86852.1 response regulator [Corallococcus sp. NCRR]
MEPRLSKRSAALAAGALVLLCALFILGRPGSTADHDRYRTQLRQLRVATSELEQDVLRQRVGMAQLHGASDKDFDALSARAHQLRSAPGFLPAEGMRSLNASLDTYLRVLEGSRALLTAAREKDQRLAALREAYPGVVAATAAALPPGAARAHVEAMDADVLLASRAPGEASGARVEASLARLAQARGKQPLAAPAIVSLDALEARTRELMALQRATDASFQALLDHGATGEAERLITTYLQLQEQSQARAERTRIVLFGVCLLLVVYVLVVLVRLARASAALSELNRGLEERVAERTQALSAASAEARASDARKAAILEASPDGIVVLDESGRVVEFNPAAASHFRLPSARAVGADFLALALPATLPASQREAVHAALLQESGAARLESPCLRADGDVFPAELTFARVHADGPPRTTVFVRDLTERKAVERMKNEFVSTVSHELRTPLTSIRGSLGLLENGIVGELPSQALDMVRIARTNTERLIRLINDILDLEKMESGMLELKLQPQTAQDLVEATLAGVQGMAETAHVTLRSDVEGAPQVKGDRDRLIQVLTNLVSNAIKFSPQGASVVVTAGFTADGRVRFSVTDQGSGIPEEKLPRLFGRFQQLDASDTRSKGGTGLGLAISQAIVEQHGGRIDVSSPPGQGATFHFTLESLRAPSVAPRPRDESRHNVLIVTADTELSALLRGLLSHEGYRVVRAATLTEAMQAVEHALPDALLVDTQMPDGTVLDWVRRLREQPRTRELPVLALSGRSQQQGVKDAGTALLVDWLPTPVDETRLLKTLRYAMRQPGQARVLVVDDDATTRRVLCAQFERLGALCIEAADGESAVALARDTPPDLIVLDVGLPRLDGFEVVDILRQGKGRATPLIVFTGRELSRTDQRQLTLGLTRHLTKARASEEELVASVRELLNGLLARRDAAAEPRKAMP